LFFAHTKVKVIYLINGAQDTKNDSIIIALKAKDEDEGYSQKLI